MTIKISNFDAADYLETEDDVRTFLEDTANTGTTSDLIHAINTAARAKGIAKISEDTGLTRNSLYKSLSENGNPHFSTIDKVIHALGFKLTLTPLN